MGPTDVQIEQRRARGDHSVIFPNARDHGAGFKRLIISHAVFQKKEHAVKRTNVGVTRTGAPRTPAVAVLGDKCRHLSLHTDSRFDLI